jgi:hypothetical protein
LRNIEQDDAGRLRAFRNRFGRTFDLEGSTEQPAAAEAPKDGEAVVAATKKEKAEATAQKSEDDEESLMDLISGGVYSKSYEQTKEAMRNIALNVKPKKGGKKGK